ncbi:MAG: hypothetical protein PHF83_04310 [Candidatus Methanomethylophilus sp.]|nr:hypothetical protein [Methanomethylophilus sp.]
MALIACTCPYCGGIVKMEDTLTSGYCTYCGRQIINDKAVVGQVNVSMDRTSEVVSVLKLAKYSMYDGDANGAGVLLSKAMQMNSENSDVWYMDAVIDRKNARADLARAKQYPSLGIFTESDVSVYKNFDPAKNSVLLIVAVVFSFFAIFACIPIAIIFEIYYLLPLVFVAAAAAIGGSVLYMKKTKAHIPEPVFSDETAAAKNAAMDRVRGRP